MSSIAAGAAEPLGGDLPRRLVALDAHATACHAPGIQLYLYPTGDVRSCCRNLTSLGNVADSGLMAIWAGAARRRLVDRLARHDYSQGCELCGSEVASEGRAGSFPETFEHWRSVLATDPLPEWPARIEFNLSTTCNLQCVQCSGESSSSIRIHREKRPPLPPVYDDRFFDELTLFLPHLRAASFAGGEPFLGAENFRVWDLIAEHAPDLPCTVITNATQWSERVESVLDRLRIHPIVSIDGATEQTYERIRVGARHAEVVANIDRLVDYSRAAGTTMNLNFCLMPDNVAEFPDMLRFAEERGITLNVCVVRAPVEHSLTRLEHPELSAVLAGLERRSNEMESELQVNLTTWRTELGRIRAWVADSGARPRTESRSPVILMFRRQGDGPVDPDLEADRLAGGAGVTRVHRLVIGADERARACPPDLAATLGLAPEEIEGQPLSVLLGVIRHYDVLERTEDRYEASMRTDGQVGRLVLVPARDDAGWADAVHALFALGPTDPGS